MKKSLPTKINSSRWSTFHFGSLPFGCLEFKNGPPLRSISFTDMYDPMSKFLAFISNEGSFTDNFFKR